MRPRVLVEFTGAVDAAELAGAVPAHLDPGATVSRVTKLRSCTAADLSRPADAP
jgi:hypothetical protein